MANVILDYPVNIVNGAIVKHGPVIRQKHYLSPDGKLIRKGKKEIYKIANPRDFNAHPQSEKELTNHSRFQLAAQRAADIQKAAKPENNPTKEQVAEYEGWFARFKAQLPGIKGNKPDPDAPIDPATHRAKRYVQFPAFLRASIYRQLKETYHII